MTADHDNLLIGVLFSDQFENLQTVVFAPLQPNIKNYEVWLALPNCLKSFGAIASFSRLEAFIL